MFTPIQRTFILQVLLLQCSLYFDVHLWQIHIRCFKANHLQTEICTGIISFYSSVGTARLWAGQLRNWSLILGEVQKIFLFPTMSRLALGSTQSPGQWVPKALSLRVKWPACEADSLPSSSKARLRMCGPIVQLSHISSWHGA
jgi:hypothetical protein